MLAAVRISYSKDIFASSILQDSNTGNDFLPCIILCRDEKSVKWTTGPRSKIHGTSAYRQLESSHDTCLGLQSTMILHRDKPRGTLSNNLMTTYGLVTNRHESKNTLDRFQTCSTMSTMTKIGCRYSRVQFHALAYCSLACSLR